MIFSSEKWSDADEIKRYIAVSTALSFQVVQPSLLSAFEQFIRPVIGDEMCVVLQEIYDNGPDPQVVEDLDGVIPDTEERDSRLLFLAQRANAFLAFWYDYDELNVTISDAGVRRAEGDSSKTLYKYQEQSIRSSLRNKGFNALDDLIRFLEANVSSYSEFEGSDLYANIKKSIVRSTAEVDQFYLISGSRLVFLRLKSHFRVIEDTIIAPRLGDTYATMITELAKETPDEKYVKLREKLIPVMVFYAVQRAIRETGSLTDKGLFFSALQGSDNSIEASSPVSDERLTAQASRAEADALSYWKLVESYLKKTLSVTISTGSMIPNRNNTDKKSFLA